MGHAKCDLVRARNPTHQHFPCVHSDDGDHSDRDEHTGSQECEVYPGHLPCVSRNFTGFSRLDES